MALVGSLVATGLGLGAAAQETSTGSAAPSPSPASYRLPPVDGTFDYQIGGDYDLREVVGIVSRDWFIGSSPVGVYGICYVNAYQTQDDEEGVHRPDEQANWPPELVLTELGDDPDW